MTAETGTTMTAKEASDAIREIAAASAKSPALARSFAHPGAAVRAIYMLCLRSDLTAEQRSRLVYAASVLDEAGSRGVPSW